jgi:hypothetical protein
MDHIPTHWQTPATIEECTPEQLKLLHALNPEKLDMDNKSKEYFDLPQDFRDNLDALEVYAKPQELDDLNRKTAWREIGMLISQLPSPVERAFFRDLFETLSNLDPVVFKK